MPIDPNILVRMRVNVEKAAEHFRVMMEILAGHKTAEIQVWENEGGSCTDRR